MENDLLFGLWTIALGTVACGMAYGVRTQAAMLKLQAEMLKHLGDLSQLISPVVAQTVPLPDWRQLPPDARLMMRNSLIEVLREMDAEMPARH